jgi:hypothetical protein
MKAHFQINQNPDSRELKMLSQKTGLDKKVLQVINMIIFYNNFDRLKVSAGVGQGDTRCLLEEGKPEKGIEEWGKCKV